MVDSFTARMELWSLPEMVAKARDFISGPEQSIDQIYEKHQAVLSQTGDLSTREQKDFLVQKLTDQQIDLYCVQLPHHTAAQAGLEVVRVFSPHLTPLFFNESNQPLALQRFTHTADGTKVTLNPVPHPFL